MLIFGGFVAYWNPISGPTVHKRARTQKPNKDLQKQIVGVLLNGKAFTGYFWKDMWWYSWIYNKIVLGGIKIFEPTVHKRARAQKPREDPQKQTEGVFSKRASAKAFAGYWLLSEKRPCHYGRFGEYLSINFLR